MAQIAKKRELKAHEMLSSEDGLNIAAIKLQARARTFLAVRRFALMVRHVRSSLKSSIIMKPSLVFQASMA